MDSVRTAFEFRMRLHRHEEMASWILHRFNKLPIWAYTAEDNTAFSNPVSEYGRYFIAMSMPLLHDILSIQLIKQRPCLNPARVGS